MKKRIAPRRHHPLVFAVLAVLLSPSLALAQSAEDSKQNDRIRQLEDQVQKLQQALQQQMQPAPQTTAQQGSSTLGTSNALVPAPSLPEGKAPIQNTSLVLNGSTFSFGGFVKLDMMQTRTSDGAIPDSSPGRMFYFPSAIPVNAGKGQTYDDFGAQFSRVWFGMDHVTDDGEKIKGYLEFDFFGGGNTNVGNEKFSNGYPPTLRHFYVTWGHWLAGQTWTNAMDLGSIPETVDFVGIVDGTLFARQAQIRYTNGGFSVSLENPQTWYQNGSPAQVSSGDNTMPDVTARWTTKGNWGHFSISGIARQLRTENDSTEGFALSVAGSFNFGDSDLLQYTVSGGPGLGRYIGFGLPPDAYYEPDGNLKAVDTYAGFIAYRHDYTERLRSTLAYSEAYMKEDADAVTALATKRTQSWRVNLIYSPFNRLDLGAELSWGQRQLLDNESGDIKRLQTTVKYTF